MLYLASKGRRIWGLTFVLLAGLLNAAGAHAFAPPHAVPVQLTGSAHALPLGPHAELLEDPTHALDFETARKPAANWQAHTAPAFRFGLSNSSWWIRVPLANSTTQSQGYVIDLNSVRVDHLRWIVMRPNGQVLRDISTGDRSAFSTRALDFRRQALPLRLGAGEQVDLYIRIESHDGLHEPVLMTVSTEQRFLADVRLEDLVLGVYFGALFALGLYNLFLYISTRTRGFITYVTYLSGLLVWNITYLGFGFEYLWPDSPRFNHNLVLVAGSVGWMGLAWFAMTYLQLQANVSRRVVNLFRWNIALNLPVIALAVTDHYTVSVIASGVLGPPILLAAVVIAYRLARNGQREARFVLIAVPLLLVGSTLFYLQLFGLIPDSIYFARGIQIGSMLEMLLLAFGLADSMNTLKAQKLVAERRAHDAQKALATDLERQVNDRTRELEKANQMLGELAITDELTGAFNRRHFNKYCGDAIDRQSRGEPLALCMFDIDHFKRYNDRYGHQAGDAVLRSVASTVAATLKRSDDQLFRLGGEEFGVLFGATSAQGARDFVESMRLALHGLELPHADNPSGIVTASFGVAWWPNDAAESLTPEMMYAAADTALYEAKNSGRDRVQLAPARNANVEAPPERTLVPVFSAS